MSDPQNSQQIESTTQTSVASMASASSTITDRQALFPALVAALGQLSPATTATTDAKAGEASSTLSPPTDPSPVPPAVSVEAQQVLEGVLNVADVNAALLHRRLEGLVDHLVEIRCPTEDVLSYLQLGRRTLASLYLLVAPGQYSPTAVQRLAFRYALDARHPVEVDLMLLQTSREAEGWRIVQFPDVGARLLGLRRSGRLIRNPVANDVLDCVLADPLRLDKLKEVIERELGSAPSSRDSLTPPAHPPFTYAIVGKAPGEVRVRLWIEEREVALHDWKDVHNLLAHLCQNPLEQVRGRKLIEKLKVANASQAVGKIKKALGAVWPGAEGWLLTGPIRWEENCQPQERPSAEFSQSKNK